MFAVRPTSFLLLCKMKQRRKIKETSMQKSVVQMETAIRFKSTKTKEEATALRYFFLMFSITFSNSRAPFNLLGRHFIFHRRHFIFHGAILSYIGAILSFMGAILSSIGVILTSVPRAPLVFKLIPNRFISIERKLFIKFRPLTFHLYQEYFTLQQPNVTYFIPRNTSDGSG